MTCLFLDFNMIRSSTGNLNMLAPTLASADSAVIAVLT